MKREVAKQIGLLMVEYGARLDESVQLVMDTSSNDEFVAYRSAVAKIMGYMLLDVMNPIYGEYPDLKPDEMD
jgi:hypothetical protein